MLMNKTELRMLLWIQSVSLREHTRNEEIREAATFQPIATHLTQIVQAFYGQKLVNLPQIATEANSTYMIS